MSKEDMKHNIFAQKRAMVYLPEDTVELEMKATIYKNGAVKTITAILPNAGIQKAFQYAEEKYTDDSLFMEIAKFGVDTYREI